MIKRIFHGCAAAVLAVAAAVHFPPSAAAGESGFTGMQVQGISPAIVSALGLDREHGVLVRDVALGSPANRAGLQRADLIVRFAGQDIDTFDRLISAVGGIEPGQKVAVSVLRRGAVVELTLEAGRRPETRRIDKGSFVVIPQAGLTLSALTAKARKGFGLRWSTVGVVVTLVAEEKAVDTDLRRGEVIVRVNQEAVWDPKQVLAKFNEATSQGRESLVLLVEGQEGSRNGFRFSVLPVK